MCTRKAASLHRPRIRYRRDSRPSCSPVACVPLNLWYISLVNSLATEIATRALLLSEPERTAYIGRACSDDPSLQQAVGRLIATQDAATIDGAIPQETLPRVVEEPSASQHAIRPEDIVDDFHILDTIGQGAMGVVYLAEQQNPRRRVALKVLRADALTPERERRFEFETESLAMLEHPGIATIYKSGSAVLRGDRRPFFAMELVDGETLDLYAHRLSQRERLALISSICDAVAHAHARGVVHRDLKPANIVIGKDRRARVLDFGVATSTGADAGVADQHRAEEFVGTVPYMSPAQLAGDGDVGPVADVYALGVVLCEILTGSRPFPIEGMSLERIRKRVERPPAIESAKLDRDIEAIIRTAIAPARRDRYQSASALRDDLERYLAHKPVHAVRGGQIYVARKFARRHRTAVALAALAMLVTVGGFVGVAYQAARATRGWYEAEQQNVRAEAALTEATAQQRRASAINRFMIDMLVSADPESTLGQQVTVVEMLDTASGTLETVADEHPEVAAGIRMALANTYRSLGRLEESRVHAEQMVRLCAEGLGEDHAMTADARRTLALVLYDFGLFSEARQQLELARPAVTDPVEAAKLQSEFARLAHGAGDSESAFELWESAEAELSELLGPEHKETLIAMHNRAMALKELGKLDESEALMLAVYERRVNEFGPDHPQTLAAIDSLAGIIQKQGRDREASEMLRDVLDRRERVLGAGHISTLVSMGNLGAALIRLGDLEQAETLTRTAMDGHRDRFGESHTRTLILMGNLAYILEDQGETDAAAALYRRTIELRRSAEGAMDPETWSTMNNLAMLLMSADRAGEAKPRFTELLALCDAALPPEHYYTALFRNNYAECLMMLAEHDGAREALDRSHPVILATFGETHPRTAKSLGRYERLERLLLEEPHAD